MSIKIEADITLLLREQDVALLLKAVQQFRAKTEDEIHGRDFLLDVLEQLSLPENPCSSFYALCTAFIPVQHQGNYPEKGR